MSIGGRVAVAAIVLIGGALYATGGKRDAGFAYIYTETVRYEPLAWLTGHDRFPQGATLQYASEQKRCQLVPEFYASADAEVSYDGRRVLFAGKPTPAGPWQIWEADLEGGRPRQILNRAGDCVRPRYLPTGEVVYTRMTAEGSELEIAGKPITFAAGRNLTDQVLRDGRILFETERLPGRRELFTVYPDGTGVESLRCDHGPDRGEARQIASGDSIFRSGERLARITSALAAQTGVPQPDAAGAGPIAEIAAGVWLVSLKEGNGRLGLYRWKAEGNVTEPLEVPANGSAVDPVIAAPHASPKQFPSALVTTRTAGNLLCLNARFSREPFDGAAVRSVRLYTRSAGQPVLLGEAPVESDGSFYIQVPADRPLRIEVADSSGRAVRGEHGWFWMRPSEQRICVGC
ncbi:MAG TPA: hypothetical protein VJ732_05745, partial [Bryobacteraceae bacterium]|nr:hypothetical protein [Bryobacteraceae bacterium]